MAPWAGHGGPLPVGVRGELDTRAGVYYRAGLSISAPKDLITCRQFFLELTDPKQRQYEALRAYFVEGRSSQEVARAFGYSVGSFRVLCHHFRRDTQPEFFATSRHGPQIQPQKTAARDTIIALRKQNYSVYEISETLQDQGTRLSPTGVREVLKAEGFAPLPRRLDDERPERPRAFIEAVADVRAFSLAPRQFTTRCGGLFLFVPDLVGLPLEPIAQAARLPGSKMIPAAHALRASLALKLWSIERKRHVMAWVTDEGLALFSGLNVTPKKSYLSEYASRVDPRKLTQMLAAWHAAVARAALFDGNSFNLDFHSVPYYGEHPALERHYVSARSRRQPSVLVFLAQDAEGRAFCYSNADIRKGEEPEEIFRFITFWHRVHKTLPRHLVFDSRLTTYANLARLDTMGVAFITLRRRSPQLLTAIAQLPRSAWRTLDLDVPTRKFRTPRVYEQKVRLAGRDFRQISVLDLGHELPTILLTNEARTPIKKLITRYAHRMLIENALSDAVRFFHMDALSSAVGFKVDFDMTLLVIASGLYRLLARRMRGYHEAQARHIFRDLVDMPATVEITNDAVTVSFHRRAHLPILMASGLFDQPVRVPWWDNRTLRLTTASA
jgi:transposase